MSKVFISYRRDDSSGYAHAILSRLVQYSEYQVTMDVGGDMEPGVQFQRLIEDAVGQCDVLLAVIGKRWATRLDNPEDYVRLEVSTALTRDIRVIPVLVDGMTMPNEDNLPSPLQPITRRDAIEIGNTRFKFDVERVITAVQKILDATEAKRKADEEAERNRLEQEAERGRREAEEQRKAEAELRREQERQRSEEETRRKTDEQSRKITISDHVFICYAREDEAFVLQLVENLKGRGVPVWLDQWDIPPGADWDRSIDEALYGCAKFIIVLSSQAVESTEVRGELRTALDERKPIIPVIHSSCRLPRQLRTIQHVDFTSRSPDDEAGLRQLLRTLATSTNSNMPQQGRATDTPERAPQEAESKLKPGTIFLDAPVKIIFERGKEPFERGFPNNLVRRFAIGIENISSERLHHCSVTIQDVNPKAKLETDSSLKLSSPQNKTFGINAFDTEYIDIVQFDELNGFHENLGIELMGYSVHGFTNLPLEHHYTLTIRASAEKGRFAEEEFNLWIQDRKVHFTKLTT